MITDHKYRRSWLKVILLLLCIALVAVIVWVIPKLLQHNNGGTTPLASSDSWTSF
jgi:hypothetical protein